MEVPGTSLEFKEPFKYLVDPYQNRGQKELPE